MNILTVNLLFSTFAFWVGARIYVFPNLADLNLLDSRILGSCVVGDALHHVRVPLEALEITVEKTTHWILGRARMPRLSSFSRLI